MPNSTNNPLPQDPHALADIFILVEHYTTTTPKSYDDKVEAGRGKIKDATDKGLDAITYIDPLLGAIRYAAMSNKLSKLQDQAVGAIETLYSYGTANQGKTAEFDIPGIGGILPAVRGLEMSNTLYTMLNADNAGEAAATLLADCVPCSERIIALLSMNPLKDLWGVIEGIYNSSIQFIFDLYDFVLGNKSVEIFADFCSLFQFLNFMCVPDLIRMVTLLTQMISKYAMKLKDIQYGLNDLLGSIAGPSLTPILGLLDKYKQLVLAPLECVLDSLDAQIQKSDVGQVQRMFTEGKPGQRSAQIPTKEISATIGGALTSLRDYMDGAIKEAEEELDKLRNDALEYIGLQDMMDRNMFDVSSHMEKLARLVGMIQAIIITMLQGEVICGPEGDENDLQLFLNNYIAPRFDLDFQVKGDQIRIAPAVSDKVEKVIASVGKVSKSLGEDAPKLGSANVMVKNCLNTITDSELEDVKDFLSTYKTKQE